MSQSPPTPDSHQTSSPPARPNGSRSTAGTSTAGAIRDATPARWAVVGLVPDRARRDLLPDERGVSTRAFPRTDQCALSR
jgi:hypothetical protein